MSNILIITPFYPYPSNKRLRSDSKAVYYLTKNKKESDRVFFVYYYLNRRINAFLCLFRFLFLNDYRKCLYKDDRNNDILLFEHPGFLPTKSNTFHFVDKKYLHLLDDYLQENNIKVDSLIVHFPSIYSHFASSIEANNKIGIIHSFDVKNAKNRSQLLEYLGIYNKMGCRSFNIRQSFDSMNVAKLPVFLCYSGIPNTYLDISLVNKDWKQGGTLSITYAGRLDSNKNVVQTIKAIALLPSSIKTSFIVIGTGEKEQALRQLAKDLDVENVVSFVGKKSRSEVFEFLKRSDLFVMTSYKETLGLSYLEAIAAANLIIGAVDQGICGIFDNSEGCYFVSPTSVDQLAKTIESVSQLSKEEVVTMRERAYEKICQMTEEQASINYFNNIINE